MSLHEHDDHDRDPGRTAPPRPRRDPLGLWSLLGPDSQFVPISDFDGAAACSGHAPEPESGADRETPPAVSSACGSCNSSCPSALLAPDRFPAHFPRPAASEEPS